MATVPLRMTSPGNDETNATTDPPLSPIHEIDGRTSVPVGEPRGARDE